MSDFQESRAASLLTPDPPRQLHVLGHNGHALGVHRAQVGVLEQADHVCFVRLLDREHGLTLEPQIILVILCDFFHDSLEWTLSYKQIGSPLEPPDFP